MAGVDNMENGVVDSLEEMKYANLSDSQEKNLRKLEKKFNEEFGSSYYFMVLDRPTHTSPN
jgi:hypothetical protein